MTTVTLDAVGLCAHPSPSGDRAFRYALSLAKAHGLQLNIFTFLHSPFEAHDPAWRPDLLSAEDRQKLLVEADQRVRMHYEDRFGDFLDVGFRVCEGQEEVELRRCLRRREYQALVIPYLERGGWFGNVSIEEFAYHFTAPVMLVGPWRKVRYWLNPPAALVADKLHLYTGTWRALPRLDASCSVS